MLTSIMDSLDNAVKPRRSDQYYTDVSGPRWRAGRLQLLMGICQRCEVMSVIDGMTPSEDSLI